MSMNPILWRGWEAVSSLAMPKLGAREMAVLLIVAASLLVFRTLRERYLMVWIVGWGAYFVSAHAVASTSAAWIPFAVPVSQAEFVLAASLFVAGALIYSNGRSLLGPLLAISVALVAFAIVRTIYWPESITLRFALEFSYRILSWGAAVWVLRYGRARREIGPWLLAAGLVSLHTDWLPLTAHLPAEAGISADMILGLGMLLVILEESRLQSRRLATLNEVATAVAHAAQNGPIAATALQQLKALMGCEAAWFRFINGPRLTIFQQIGLSEEFMQERASVDTNDPLEKIPSETAPVVFAKSNFGDQAPLLRRERLRQLVVVAVPGRKALVGTLVLANRRAKAYSPDEMHFVVTCAKQLGLALENLHLVEEILRSHRQWSNTFESIQDLVLLHDADFHILKANPSLLSRLGKSQSDVVGQLCEGVLPKQELGWANCPYCHGQEDGFYEGPDPFGGFSVASTSTYVDQGTKQQATIHVVRDITERRAAEEKYRSLFEQVQEGVFVTTPDGKLLDCNDAFVRMLGYGSREALLGRNLDADFYTSPQQRKTFRYELEAHNFVRDFEVTLRRKDGSMLTAVESSFAFRDQAGNIERYQGFLLDITEKKHAEDEIRRRNRELNALNAMAVIATQSFDLDEILNLTLRQVISLIGAEAGSVYLAEPDNRFRRRANWGQRITERKRAAEVVFSEGLGELVTRSRTEVLTAEYLPHLPTSVRDFVGAADAGSSIWVLLWGKDDPLGLMGISRGQHQDYTANDENLLVAIGRQLSTTVEKVRLYEETCKAYDNLRQAQEQLLQSEKMSAIGQLIAGVAHELNNPLTAILGYAQLLESEKLDPKAMEYASKIFKQGQRTHRVVQNLLSFARQRKPQKEEFNVIEVLEEVLLLRDYDLKVGNVTLERDIEPGLPAVFGDPHQLEQVFLNIVNNGLDAITDEEGESRKDGRESRLKVRMFAKENWVHIEFQDSGPGIKEPTRIFEPFYTTKSVGKGTGLGLSICYGIVKEHGGEISARNGETGGAIIELRLPSAGRAAASQPRAAAPAREALLKGKILLVEDEESVLDFEREVLSGAGAQVVAVASIDAMKEALRSQSCDAVVMNGKMPASSGVQETRKWVNENWPELQNHLMFTFSSLAEPDVRAFLEQNEVQYLVKPFQIGDLINAARKLLQKNRAVAAAAGE
jgi:PAS domain S-box-containing protein